MSTRIIWRSVAASALIALFTASSTVGAVAETVAAVPDNSAAAADSADTANLPDPPGRVGRLSYMDGTVSFHSQGQDQWSPATLNFPVTTGDSFWTEPNSKAEIQVGELAVRVDEKTAIDIARLDDEGTQIAVEQGTVNVTMPAMPEGGVQVLTAHGDVTLTQPGRYRIDAGEMSGDAPGPQVLVAVLDGEARVDAKSGTQVIRTGHSVTASGDPVTFAVGTAQPTDFDNWARSRDPQPAAANAAAGPAPGTNITWNTPPVVPQTPTTQYVSPDMTGYQDLQTYGSWNTVSDYGPVWYPAAVPVDWAPYRYGHWAFVAPWGWTWIDDQPWGFAPFHYGRWVRVHDRWGWCPGEFARRPVYAPALVAFIGGDDFGISISIGRSFPAVGWVPLAPREAFHPYYHATPRYVRNVNVANVTVVNNITVINNNATASTFANSAAATVVPADSFRNSAPVSRARVTVAGNELAQAHVRGAMRDVRPTEAARSGVAIAAAADKFVPQAGAEAKVVTVAKTESGSAGASGQNTGGADFAAPKGPGPGFNRNGRAAGFGERNAPARDRGAQPAANPASIAPAAGPSPQAEKPAANAPAIENQGAMPGNAEKNEGAAIRNGRNENATVNGSKAESQTTPAPSAAPGPPIRHNAGGARSRFAPGLAARPESASPKEVHGNSATANPTAAPGTGAPERKSAPGPAIVRSNVAKPQDQARTPTPAPGNSASEQQNRGAPGPKIIELGNENRGAGREATPPAENPAAGQARSRFNGPGTAAARHNAPPAAGNAAPGPQIGQPETLNNVRSAPRDRGPVTQMSRPFAPAVRDSAAQKPQPNIQAAPVQQPVQREIASPRPQPAVRPAPRPEIAPQQAARPPAVERAPQQSVQQQAIQHMPPAAAGNARNAPQTRQQIENAQQPAGNGPQQKKSDDQRRGLN